MLWSGEKLDDTFGGQPCGSNDIPEGSARITFATPVVRDMQTALDQLKEDCRCILARRPDREIRRLSTTNHAAINNMLSPKPIKNRKPRAETRCVSQSIKGVPVTSGE